VKSYLRSRKAAEGSTPQTIRPSKEPKYQPCDWYFDYQLGFGVLPPNPTRGSDPPVWFSKRKSFLQSSSKPELCYVDCLADIYFYRVPIFLWKVRSADLFLSYFYTIRYRLLSSLKRFAKDVHEKEMRPYRDKVSFLILYSLFYGDESVFKRLLASARKGVSIDSILSQFARKASQGAPNEVFTFVSILRDLRVLPFEHIVNMVSNIEQKRKCPQSKNITHEHSPWVIFLSPKLTNLITVYFKYSRENIMKQTLIIQECMGRWLREVNCPNMPVSARCSVLTAKAVKGIHRVLRIPYLHRSEEQD